MTTLPPHIANAETPRCSKTISEQDAVNAPWHAFIAVGELAKQLERENLYLREVAEKMAFELKDLRLSHVGCGGETVLARINSTLTAYEQLKKDLAI